MTTLGVVLLYLLLVLAIGALSHRVLRRTGEDYFVASRTIGPFVLLMSLFGTHMTAFSLLGASGEAYHRGVGVFSLMASSSALVVPLVFFSIGTRLWALGKRHGFVTQVQFFRERWGSEAVGLALFVLLVALLVPYLLIGVLGAGITLQQITGGTLPQWLGSLVICAVVLVYVTSGGVRGTAWANTFQTLVFMLLGGGAFLVIVGRHGGVAAAVAEVAARDPGLLFHGDRIPPAELLTFTLVPLSVGMFPHIFMHWLTARRAATFKAPICLYPVCVAAVWLPTVLLGVVGTLDFPALEGAQASSVLVRLIDLHAPELLAGLLAAGVVAAIMSSLDSQVLALSSMFTHDVVRRLGRGRRLDEGRQVLVARLFVAAILGLTFFLSLVVERSIFKLGIWSFTGFSALFPLVVGALFWRRSTWQGAMAAMTVGAGLWIYYFLRGAETPGYTVAGTGVMPVAVLVVATSLALMAGSWLSAAPEAARVERFFGSDAAGGRKAA